MYEITYQDFLRSLREFSFANSFIEDQMYSLQELISEDEVQLFYPKNFMFKDKPIEETELLIVTKSKVCIVGFLEQGFINLDERSLDSVTRIKISHKNRNASILTICFNDGNTFILDSLNDSQHHKSKLQQKVIEICKYISEVLSNRI
ncbi:hypothetical protein HNO89_001355 [Sporosarcina luteola]|nr:hypothetical protein [Sporosarcina luteola]